MQLNLNELSSGQNYHLMTQSLIPRPIAWVLSSNEQGKLNLAPFSFFTGVCSSPPLVMLSVGNKSDGQAKDTRANLLTGRDFVIHIPAIDAADDVTLSAKELPATESELDLLSNAELVEFAGCPLPRLAAAPLAFQARLHKVDYLGDQPHAVIYAELIQAYISDEVLNSQAKAGRLEVDANKVNPLARLGAGSYVGIAEAFKA